MSLLAGEPLSGTATQAIHWFLLEYNGLWGAKAFEESRMPAEVKEYLSSIVEGNPLSRIQLIRRPVPQGVEKLEDAEEEFTPGKSFACYVAITTELNPRLFEFHLDSYSQILELDIPGLLGGETGFQNYLRQDPLYLVCTNGRRDACCARFGPQAYTEISMTAGDETWQTTHVGGHRFAPNLVCLPHGLFYGRLQPGEAKVAVQGYRQGQIYLPKLRGRSCFPEVVQAAEIALRQETGIIGLSEFRLVDSQEIQPDRWHIHFYAQGEEVTYRLVIERELSEAIIAQSCNSSKLSPVNWYHLIQCEEEKGS